MDKRVCSNTGAPKTAFLDALVHCTNTGAPYSQLPWESWIILLKQGPLCQLNWVSDVIVQVGVIEYNIIIINNKK